MFCGYVCSSPFLWALTILPYCLCQNLAIGKPTAQSSDQFPDRMHSYKAVDGNTNPDGDSIVNSCSHTNGAERNPWWTVDLQGVYTVQQVVVYNRNRLRERLDNLYVEGFVWDPFLRERTGNQLCGHHPGPSGATVIMDCVQEIKARFIRLRGPAVLTLCEVKIYGQLHPDQVREIVLCPPTCPENSARREEGKKLTSLSSGTVLNSLSCLHECQKRPGCTMFSFNNVTTDCIVSGTISPLSNDDITSAEYWMSYVLC